MFYSFFAIFKRRGDSSYSYKHRFMQKLYSVGLSGLFWMARLKKWANEVYVTLARKKVSNLKQAAI